jgi:hypothetical protein
MPGRRVHVPDQDMSQLAEIMPFWEELGFEPWSWNDLAGVKRRITFRKGSLLGEVASYYADDYIVWEHQLPEDAKVILENWQPATDVMAHRFLLLSAQSAAKPMTKAFWFGFKGWVDVLPYCLGDSEVKKFNDLIFLVNKGWQYMQKTKVGTDAWQVNRGDLN